MKTFRSCMKMVLAVLPCVCALCSAAYAQDRRIEIGGVYPHLAMFNDEDECGTGALVPWADRLWVVTYAPHKPQGSTDKLYEIAPSLDQVIRPESIGGTPANRMIHRESAQLFIGPYAISSNRNVRAIPYSEMFGRPTGLARHLTQPEEKVVCATMEEGVYEIDVNTLKVTELWADEQKAGGQKANLPGYHGKGFYSAQGRYIYANNGDHAKTALTNPEVESGVLAEWDGRSDSWKIVRRNQFTDVSGPGCLHGNSPSDDRAWSIGWDHRSLILMLLENGAWHSYRLPKASHCYDGAHGWNTEWPRFRDIGEDHLLMTMHGQFWKFPKQFSSTHSAGIVPLSTYLKVIGDFCRWEDRIVFGCDDTARNEFLNKERLKGKVAPPGKSQSNLWFVRPDRLDSFGPPLGRGAVWLQEDVQGGVASEPYMFDGFSKRTLFLLHAGENPVTFSLEVDDGSGTWGTIREISLAGAGSAFVEFTRKDKGAWIRLRPSRDARKVTAFFAYQSEDKRSRKASSVFSGLASVKGNAGRAAVLHTGTGGSKVLSAVIPGANGPLGYELNENLELVPASDLESTLWISTNVAVPPPLIHADAASAVYVDENLKRWRLPISEAGFRELWAEDHARLAREVCTERNLLNAYGTFYELPAPNAGGFPKLRPVASHNLRIHDFASYRGLLVMSGVASGSKGGRIIRSADGKCALWVGVVDELWKLGKPRGKGGPWMNSKVISGEPSDPYLATGYDRKCLTISHKSAVPVLFRVEADITGAGQWTTFTTLKVNPKEDLDYRFPEAFGAYWLRLISSETTIATAQFRYD